MSDKKASSDIQLFQLSNYVKPDVKEFVGRKWVLNGDKNSFFQYIIERYIGSPTNSSIINVYCELLYGKGIVVNGQEEIYKELNEIFPKSEQRKCLKDLKQFGQYDMQIIRGKSLKEDKNPKKVAKIMHIPTNKLGMDKADKDGNINGVWYSEDWKNTWKYKPEFIPAFKGELTESRMIKSVRPYQPGQFYFSNPEYLQGLQYAEMEEEIANFCINHIKSGLSFGYVINFNNGMPTDEEKAKIEDKIKNKLTGSSNAGRFMLSFNDGKDAEVTVVPLEVNEAHNQWEFLTKEARQQLLTAHGVTSALLFGIQTGTGFSSNADELDTASKLLQDYQINPKQSLFIDELADVLELNGLETDLAFLPLRETYKSEESTDKDPIDETIDKKEDEDVKMTSHNIAEHLINLGEEISEEWELVDERPSESHTLSELQLNTIIEFKAEPRLIGRNSNKPSEQDTSLFRVRYKYAGHPSPEREFCSKLMKANRIYRSEDLEAAEKLAVNPGLGPEGSDNYSIWLYKGGVNCKHWWQRVIYLKKNNKVVSANEARKLILKLEPKDRKDAKWNANEREVARVADKKNNFWKLKSWV